MKRVNLRSFRKKLKHNLSQTENGGKFISFLEIDDSNTRINSDDLVENAENPVYALAVHQNLWFKNNKSVQIRTESKKLQEVITKDCITKSKQE